MAKRSTPRRRQRGEGGLYKRKSDGLWVGTVDVGEVNGVRRRKTVTSKSYQTAFDKLADLKRTVRDHGAAPDATTTVGRWLDHWLTDIAAPRNKPRTIQGYRTSVTQHLVPHLGKKRLDQLTPQHVRDMHRALTKAGLSGATALKAHNVLSKSLTDAQRDGRVTRNVAQLVDPPRKVTPVQDVLTADEAKQLLAHLVATEDRLGSRWAMALLTGQRQGECLGLTWDRVDLDEGTVDTAWQLQRLGYRHGCGDNSGTTAKPSWPCDRRWGGDCPHRELDVHAGFDYKQLEGGLCLARPKSRAGMRLIPLPAPLLIWLRERAKNTEPRTHNLVWTRPDGRPLDPSHDNKAWHAALAAAGVRDVDLKSARHTTATLLMELGVDPQVAQSIMGHSSARTTAIYQHVRQPLQRAAMDSLGGLFAIER